jgi:hypothetical protein
MSLDQLNEEEKNILLQLSYFDLPSQGRHRGLTIEEIWEKVKNIPGNGGEARRERLEEYFSSDRYKNSNLAEVTLSGYKNNNPKMNGESESGFVGYAWGDRSGNATAVFRGSEDMKNWDHFKTDWGSNGAAGLGIEIQQQREADQFYQRFVQSAPGEKLVFGHSKGGNLASYVFVNHLEDNVLGYVINGAPIFWPTLTPQQQEALKSGKFDFIAYEGDFVHDLGYAPYVDKIVVINKEDYDDPFYPHYETSVDFVNGSFEKEKPATITTRNEIYAEIIKLTAVYGVNEVHEAYKVARAMGNAALMVIQTTWKGMEAAGKVVIDGFIAYFKGLKLATAKAVNDLVSFFSSVKEAAKRLLFGRVVSAFAGGFAEEPYLKVDIQRLAYYVQRLETIKRKTSALNSRIDGLYWEAGLFGIDNVLKADILTSFNGKINQNITYLNKAAQLLERTERTLVSKARSIH